MSEPTAATLFDRALELTIAFVLPGLIVLFGLAMVNQIVATWFLGAQNGPNFSGIFFVICVALAFGLVITSIRWFIFEYIRLPRFGCIVKNPTPYNRKRRPECEQQYLDLRRQFYYHYLASANMSVAIPLSLTVWKLGQPTAPTWWFFLPIFFLVAAVSLVLGLAGCDAVKRYNRERVELLGPPMDATAIDASTSDSAAPATTSKAASASA